MREDGPALRGRGAPGRVLQRARTSSAPIEAERPSGRAPSFELARSLGEAAIGVEARAQAEDQMDVRVWLRLLACATQVEQEIRQRLRDGFAITLARFDYLAQLERHPDGLRMNQLSRYLMVTGGNVTGLTDQLVKEGLVERIAAENDRRSWLVRLTASGRREFGQMARAHEQWLRQMFAGLAAGDKADLYRLLGELRIHLARQGDPAPTAADAPRASPIRTKRRPSDV